MRRPDGKLLKVVDESHYETFLDDSVVYWVLQSRQFMAYRVSDGTTRSLSGYKPAAVREVTSGVLVSPDGSRLEMGRKDGDSWRYEPLVLTPAQVMKNM